MLEMAMHTPTLLTLPLELRSIIYSELLSSKRSSPLELYNHSKGREDFFELHPFILRTNKQIYSEAISYLYNDNIFNLHLDGPISTGCHIDNPDHKRPLLPLLRDDTLRTAVLEDGEDYDRPRKIHFHINQYKEMYRDCRCHLLPLPGPGPIYPHILRRLAHIELCIGAFSIMWEYRGGRSLSETGKVVLYILRILAEDEIKEDLVTRKTLKIEIRAKWVDDGLFLGDKGPSLSREDGQALRVEMLALLREIKKRSVVEVTEAVLDHAKGRNEILKVDVETGEAFQE